MNFGILAFARDVIKQTDIEILLPRKWRIFLSNLLMYSRHSNTMALHLQSPILIQLSSNEKKQLAVQPPSTFSHGLFRKYTRDGLMQTWREKKTCSTAAIAPLSLTHTTIDVTEVRLQKIDGQLGMTGARRCRLRQSKGV